MKASFPPIRSGDHCRRCPGGMPGDGRYNSRGRHRMLAEGPRCRPETGGRDDRTAGRQIVLAMITDADGRLAFANGELLALGGWRWSDLSGRLWHEVLIAPEHRRRVVRAFERAVTGKDGTACVEAPIRTSDGRVRVVAWTATPSLDEAGRPTAVTSVGGDVTGGTEGGHRPPPPAPPAGPPPSPPWGSMSHGGPRSAIAWPRRGTSTPRTTGSPGSPMPRPSAGGSAAS